MNLTEMQTELDALAVAMAEKGLATPSASLRITSDTTPDILLRWEPESDGVCDGMKFIRWEGSLQSTIAEAQKWIASLPAPEEHHREQFLKLVAKAADYGNAHGIDSDFVNPLTEAMKRLSENCLTDGAAA